MNLNSEIRVNLCDKNGTVLFNMWRDSKYGLTKIADITRKANDKNPLNYILIDNGMYKGRFYSVQNDALSNLKLVNDNLIPENFKGWLYKVNDESETFFMFKFHQQDKFYKVIFIDSSEEDYEGIIACDNDGDYYLIPNYSDSTIYVGNNIEIRKYDSDFYMIRENLNISHKDGEISEHTVYKLFTLNISNVDTDNKIIVEDALESQGAYFIGDIDYYYLDELKQDDMGGWYYEDTEVTDYSLEGPISYTYLKRFTDSEGKIRSIGKDFRNRWSIDLSSNYVSYYTKNDKSNHSKLVTEIDNVVYKYELGSLEDRKELGCDEYFDALLYFYNNESWFIKNYGTTKEITNEKLLDALSKIARERKDSDNVWYELKPLNKDKILSI